MTRPPTNPEPLDIIARELHEHARRRIENFPPWGDLDPTEPWHAELIRLAYRQAHDLIAFYGGEEE